MTASPLLDEHDQPSLEELLDDTPEPSTRRLLLPLSQLIPNPRNDRVHPPRQIEMLVKSIERFGQPRPILARAQNRMIIAGHAIHLAMGEAGKSDIDVLLWDVDQKTADAYLEADNRFSELGRVDPERRRALLEELALADEELPGIGFEPDEVRELLDAGGPALRVHDIDTAAVDDQFWITLRGPLADQAQVLLKLQLLLADFDRVEIDLGTIAIEGEDDQDLLAANL